MGAKKESTFTSMVLTLFIVTAVAALALGGVYELTKGPIALAKKKKQEKAIKMVLPAFDKLKSEKVLSHDGGDSLLFTYAYNNDKLIGVAVNSYSDEGFSGHVEIMVGFLPDGTIYNTAVMAHKETPGLGTKMAEPEFKDQFKNKNPNNFILKVTKDGGDVDAITAATISSRAFCDAVDRAYKTFEKVGIKKIKEKNNDPS
jgi:electron transport complex protein RnfG